MQLSIPKTKRPIKNLSGKTFGRLKVSKFSGYRSGRTLWLCQCKCGRQALVTGNMLNRGDTKSCGCLKAEKFPTINTRHGHAKRGNQMPIYRRWKAMRYRCNPKAKKFSKMYFERGISVCDEWRDFKVFLADMGRSFRKHLTLHRKDNDLGYCKSNCKWATASEQARATTRSRFITIHGKTRCLKDWAIFYGTPIATFYKRIKNGMNDIQAIST